MSHQELSRLEIVQKIINKQLKQRVASDLLGITPRQIQRLVHNYRLNGTLGLISKKRNKPSNNKISGKKKDEIIAIVGSKYLDFGPTLAHEKLREIHHIEISVETLRKMMITAGFWLTRAQIVKRAYQPRNRRNCYGELIQIDGSLHPWFEDRAPKCTLLVYIDDATGKLMELYFAPSESMNSYFVATKNYIQAHGKPITFYSDKLGVFRVNSKSSKDMVMTQFCRGLYELNIDLIYANSPQAKGRVERANKTLQDRLVKELRIRSISSIEDANKFMEEFKADFNQRFAKIPLSSINSHRILQSHENIEKSLCFKAIRTLTCNLTIQQDRVQYLIDDTEENRKLKRQKIDLHEYPDGTIALYYEGRELKYRKLYDRVNQVVQGDIVPNKRIEQTLELIKNMQQLKEITRSSNAPRKRHLGFNYKTKKQLNNEIINVAIA
jgi:hypothetical protein